MANIERALDGRYRIERELGRGGMGAVSSLGTSGSIGALDGLRAKAAVQPLVCEQQTAEGVDYVGW